MEGPKPPQPPGNNASVEYDELSRWCQQLMAEQQKMREDLKVHQLQTKERAEVRIRIESAMWLLTIDIR